MGRSRMRALPSMVTGPSARAAAAGAALAIVLAGSLPPQPSAERTSNAMRIATTYRDTTADTHVMTTAGSTAATLLPTTDQTGAAPAAHKNPEKKKPSKPRGNPKDAKNTGTGNTTLTCPGNNCSLKCTGTGNCSLKGCTTGCTLKCSGTSTCTRS